MTDRSKQIIPDSQAVVSFVDRQILTILDSGNTFIISELLEVLKGSNIDDINSIDRVALIENLTTIVADIIQQGHSRQYLMNKVSIFLKGSILDPERDNSSINNALLFGVNCNLLQPDGKGWQKGNLKICFEFIPEESDLTAAQEPSAEIHSSPLDEIRQLSNDLTSIAILNENLRF